MGKLVAGIVTVVAGALGSVLTFVDPRTVISWGLGFGRHNDRVLIGVLLLEIAFVSAYWLIAGKNVKKSKPAKKLKKRKK